MKFNIKQKIVIGLFFLVVCLNGFAQVNAEITTNRLNDGSPASGGTTAVEMDDPNNPGSKKSVLEFSCNFLEASLGSETVVGIVTALARWFILMFMKVVGVIFSRVGIMSNTTLYFPMPEHMVFNMIPFFDPNFINPASAPVGAEVNYIEIVSKVVAPLYYSSVILVSTLFVCFALAIGIKLAISISAQEKAQYKTAVGTWITGIILLFTGHLLMAGIFGINEQIVAKLYEATQRGSLEFVINVYQEEGFLEKYGAAMATGAAGGTLIGGFVGTIAGAIGGLAVGMFIAAFTDEAPTIVKAYGFEGLFLMYLQLSAYRRSGCHNYTRNNSRTIYSSCFPIH
ncbi:MAG: hypothetical protein RR751_04440 [Clostridia bacterium]